MLIITITPLVLFCDKTLLLNKVFQIYIFAAKRKKSYAYLKIISTFIIKVVF